MNLYSWYDFHSDAREIIKQIKEQEITITGVIAVPRGGLVLATLLSHAFCVPLYIGNEPEPWMPTTFLACDDMTITGHALSTFARYGMPCAVLVKHPSAPGIHPFFFAQEDETEFVFPWEADAPQQSWTLEDVVAGAPAQPTDEAHA